MGKVEIVREASGLNAMGGYYAWLVIEPLTRSEVEELGNRLIQRMKARSCDHLKAFLYFRRDDLEHDRLKVAFLNSTGPAYALSVTGNFPETRATKRSCFRAFRDSLQGSLFGDMVRYQYDDSTNSLEIDDHVYGKDELCIEIVVVHLINQYLAGSGYGPWQTIPDLEQITIRLHWSDNAESDVTLIFDREAHQIAHQLLKHLWEARLLIEDSRWEAVQRRNSHLMTEDEYEAVERLTARQIYALYEQMWLDLYRHIVFETNIELPKGGDEALHRYF